MMMQRTPKEVVLFFSPHFSYFSKAVRSSGQLYRALFTQALFQTTKLYYLDCVCPSCACIIRNISTFNHGHPHGCEDLGMGSALFSLKLSPSLLLHFLLAIPQDPPQVCLLDLHPTSISDLLMNFQAQLPL